jgi:hypothetical protein
MNAAKANLVVLEDKKTNQRKTKAKAKAGAAKMREAADEVVSRDCRPIVEALSNKGQAGQILSAKFLYELAHRAEETGETEDADRYRSLALELANSPEWKGELRLDEEDDEAIED